MATVQTPGELPAVGFARPDDTPPDDPRRHLRRNTVLTIGEIISFSIGAAFFDASTVLVGFVATLTASTIFLGLVPTIFQVGIGLPQLLVARFLARRPRKIPLLIVASLFRNIPIFVLAAFAWSRPEPAMLLLVFFVCYALFAIGVGAESVAWIDIFAKIAPPERRGQISAIGRTAGNIFSLAAGFLVSRVLASQDQFPRNYGFLFLAAGVLLTVAFGVFAFVHEPIDPAPIPAESPRGAPDDRSILSQGRQVWRHDGRFRGLLGARVLYIAHLVAIPFYLRFARDTVGVDDASIGLFVSASMLGQLLANGLWGWISSRFGNQRVVQGALVIATLIPLYVLLTPYLPQQAFLLVYVAVGAVIASEFIGWMNLLLEIAPAPSRPLYISLQGTLLLPANLFPLFGGVALSVLPYRVFFPLIAVALAVGCVLVSRLGTGMRAHSANAAM